MDKQRVGRGGLRRRANPTCGTPVTVPGYQDGGSSNVRVSLPAVIDRDINGARSRASLAESPASLLLFLALKNIFANSRIIPYIRIGFNG